MQWDWMEWMLQLMYVCVTSTNMQADADNIEAMRVKKQALKKPGHYGTDADGIVHLLVRDEQSKNIYAELKQLSLEGNLPGLHLLSQDKCNDAKRVCNYCHSSKALVSKIEEQIIDAKCFLIFKEGELGLG